MRLLPVRTGNSLHGLDEWSARRAAVTGCRHDRMNLVPGLYRTNESRSCRSDATPRGVGLAFAGADQLLEVLGPTRGVDGFDVEQAQQRVERPHHAGGHRIAETNAHPYVD